MSAIAYTVTATFPDVQCRDEYVRWLREGHLARVLEAGAVEARVVVLDEPASPMQVEARYAFASREGLDRYLGGVASRLRAEGLARFGPARGVTFERTVGQFAERVDRATGNG